MLCKDVLIRQHIDLDRDGDEVRVLRVLRSGDRCYVEVAHTVGAKEATIMRAVNQALNQMESQHGQKS